MRTFAELDFLAKAENVVFIGPTAVGKTGLASGLVLKALENGYRCQFIRAQDLFDEMYASLADRSSRQLVKRPARLDILYIDELGYSNLKPEQTNIFFKLMEERYRRHSTIITTNLMYDEWPKFLGNRPMAEALLSRSVTPSTFKARRSAIRKGEIPKTSSGGEFQSSALGPPLSRAKMGVQKKYGKMQQFSVRRA
jgi:DNA replication protein DnaC